MYVPALHHILRYKVPECDREHLLRVAHSLLACGGYVEASFVGYPDGFWWRLILMVAEKTRGLISAEIHVGPSGLVDDCGFMFSDGSKRCGFIAYDIGSDTDDWRRQATESTRRMREVYSADRMAVVVGSVDGDPGKLRLESADPVISGDDLEAVATRLLKQLL